MLAHAKQMSCGHCGEQKFNIFCTGAENTCGFRLHIECLTCKSVTEVAPAASKFGLFWSEGAKGILS